MKTRLLFLFFSLSLGTLLAQGVSINESGADPHTSAILDAQSDDKGVLIPRMTTAQRTAITTPATGLIVYDTNTNSFWYRLTIQWVELTDNYHGLRDADHDTQVQVEESADEDAIRFDIGGVEGMVLTESTQGATRLDIGPDHGLIIGYEAGTTSYPGWNTFLGFRAGQNNTDGDRNVFVGYRAGQNNGAGRDRNVLIGYEAGENNNGGFNTMIGHHAGHANSTGASNSFLGYNTGIQNTTGYRNTFLGSQAGHNNETNFNNTMVGFNAGYANEADNNTFLGVGAGRANRSGIYNIAIGVDAAGHANNGKDMGDGNIVMGFQAGYFGDHISENILLGYRSGYLMTTASNNVLIGHEAGFQTRGAHGNVGVGIDALHENRNGNNNVAIGDSALYENLSGGNVAVGTKAGFDNTNGGANTFIGNNAGANTTVGDLNTFVGWRTGIGNVTGEYNVSVGAESGNSLNDGDGNTFIGYATGFRNDGGNQNVFVGHRAGEYNISGSNNIGIGYWSSTRNANGQRNIAIGEYALGDPVGGSETINNNIAIGYQAGQNMNGNSNVVIGNSTGMSMSGGNNVLIGNNIQPSGMNNTYLGTGTAGNIIFSPEGATAVGYNTLVSQDHSVILGDASNSAVAVGIGTTTPDAKLQVNGSGGEIIRLTSAGTPAFTVTDAREVLVHDELLINTATGKPGYEMSVNGEIVCEEVLVELEADWPDYVFADDYQLMSIPQLKQYLQKEKHLPGIPSAAEVAEEGGVKVGDMQLRMMEKIEEMALYIIELEERVKSLENK